MKTFLSHYFSYYTYFFLLKIKTMWPFSKSRCGILTRESGPWSRTEFLSRLSILLRICDNLLGLCFLLIFWSLTLDSFQGRVSFVTFVTCYWYKVYGRPSLSVEAWRLLNGSRTWIRNFIFYFEHLVAAFNMLSCCWKIFCSGNMLKYG